jgi:uncharacterized membrane protein YdjX (TVP38/TMEM64 family)
VAAALVATAIVSWHPLVQLMTDAGRARAWLTSLGPWGPAAMILASAGQIVFAPIPGYFVQLAGGYLFGAVPGTLYGVSGMLTGGALAMTLARRFGRPFVQHWFGAERVGRWERATHANATWVWFLLMTGPVGDLPYYLAGLTQVPVWKILGIVLITRGPAVGMAAAVGAGAVNLSPQLLLGILLAVLLLGILLFRVGRPFARRFESFVLQRLAVATETSQEQS